MPTVMPAQATASNQQPASRSDIRQARQFGEQAAERGASFRLDSGKSTDADHSAQTVVGDSFNAKNSQLVNTGDPAAPLPVTNQARGEETSHSSEDNETDQDLSDLVQQLFASLPVSSEPTRSSIPQATAAGNRGHQTGHEAVLTGTSSANTAASPTATLSAQMLSAVSGDKEMSASKSTPLTLDGLQSVTQTAQPNANALSSGVTFTASGITSNPATTHTGGTEWASVRIDTQAGKWGEQMLQVLQDRVTLQAQQNLQEAKIRLDPPDLGKLDLMVRVEGDRLSVQIHANNAATREALMQVSDRLRAELQNQNFVHVDVNVGSERGDQSQQQPSQQDSNTTILAARDNEPAVADMALSEHWLSTRA